MNVYKIPSIVVAAALLLVTVGLSACSEAGFVKPAAPQDSSRHDPKRGSSYKLKRNVYRVELSDMPLSRTRCWLSTNGTTSDERKKPYTDTHTFEWDPSSRAPLVRFASLRPGKEGEEDLRCSAEAVQIGKEEDGKNFVYEFIDKKSLDAAKGEILGRVGTLKRVVSSKPEAPPTVDLKPLEVTVRKIDKGDPDLEGLDGFDESFSKNRSLDPLTPIATELLTVIAEIAVERAKTSATEAIKDVLRGTVCQIKYDHDDSAEIFFPESSDVEVSNGKKIVTKVERSLGQARRIISDAKTLSETIKEASKKKRASAVAARDLTEAISGQKMDRRAKEIIEEHQEKESEIDVLGKMHEAVLSVHRLDEETLSADIDKVKADFGTAYAAYAGMYHRDPGFGGCLVGAAPETNCNLKNIADGVELAVAHDLQRIFPALDTVEGSNVPDLVPVFSRVCKTLDGLRIEEIASSSTVLVRALSGDLTEYAFRYMRAKIDDADARDFVHALEPVILGLIEGKTIGTERDFQVMLLKIGQIGIPEDEKKSAEAWWQCGIGIGFAVVRECLRRDTCTAEHLASSFEGELIDPNDETLCATQVQLIEKNWPELRTILSRSIDVFRPPPGTSANQTAKVATNILLDVLKQSPKIQKDITIRREFDAVRSLINAVFDKDIAAGAAAASGMITAAIDARIAECSAKKCATTTTSAQMKKGVALLNAFVSYASTYKQDAREGEDGKTPAEREKLRHDERKKAMESLIDAAADRSNRGGNWIFSAGVSAGFGFGRTPLHGASWTPIPAPSLALGFALERLPTYTPAEFRKGTILGGHLQASIFDLAQYASLDSDGRTPTLRVENALFFGLNGGFLLGTPKYSVLIGGEVGYAPSLKFTDASKPGVLRVGAILGTYVPFFDFN